MKLDEFDWAGPDLKKRLEEDPLEVLKDRGLTLAAEIPQEIVLEFVRVACLLWVDGQPVGIDRFYIDPADEGLLFGRGVWESTRTVSGVPWLWPLHLDRARKTIALLNLNVDPARLPTIDQVTEHVRSLTRQDVIVRLNITAGRPGKPGLVWMSTAPMPMAPKSLRLVTYPIPVQKGHAYHVLKTFQYATRLRIAQDARRSGYDSALMLDPEGNIQEAAQANIFLRTDQGWLTPFCDGGFLPGTLREWLVQKAPIKIRQEIFPIKRLDEVHEVFLTNSNIGIVPVTQIDQKVFAIGADTENLMRWLHPVQPPGVPQYRFVDSQEVTR